MFLNIDEKQIGQIGGGNASQCISTSAMIQSLVRKGKVDDLVAATATSLSMSATTFRRPLSSAYYPK